MFSFFDAYDSEIFSTTLDRKDDMTQMVYQGIIRRITHDYSKARIELEDLTEQKTHKNLPQESLGDGDNIPDKYKNKPIPMVYGHVEKSPCVLSGNDLKIDYKDIIMLSRYNS